MTLTQKIRIPNHILSQATDSLHSGKFMVIMWPPGSGVGQPAPALKNKCKPGKS
jgi:hypothetical protein